MQHTSIPRVKICCIGSVEEAWSAINHGASALGLVSEMPSGPGVIPENLIKEIARAAPPSVATFLLTCKQDAQSIVEQQRRCGTNTIQICDRLESGSYREIRARLPGIKIVQVIHVAGEESIKEAIEVAEHVDAILLDSGNQKLPVKELGGTGRTHDWRLSHKIVERVSVPVFLAGGLKAENVREAIEQVRPFGLDVCSGVRTNGQLDDEKLARMFEALRETAYQAAI
ncbi:MAG TPA: phosphoribosylanthranilate isomerase [Pyrinomonadaceae bacterium]|nr:phosphoribosylanthranilate isomerase [Pyrinomonadaceae bacterium]